MAKLVGACECGAVRSRKATGSAFKALAGLERVTLEVTVGGDSLMIVCEPDANDTRCAACGPLLYSVLQDGEWAHVALGSLIDAPSIRPTERIFVGSKAPWFEITDDLPQNDQL